MNRTLLLVSLVVTSLFTVGCGGGGDTQTAAVTPPPPAPSVTPPPTSSPEDGGSSSQNSGSEESSMNSDRGSPNSGGTPNSGGMGMSGGGLNSPPAPGMPGMSGGNSGGMGASSEDMAMSGSGPQSGGLSSPPAPGMPGMGMSGGPQGPPPGTNMGPPGLGPVTPGQAGMGGAGGMSAGGMNAGAGGMNSGGLNSGNNGLVSEDGGMGNQGSGFPGQFPGQATPPPPPRKLTMRERAESAFSKGHEKEAVAYIYAHLLASESESSDYLDRIRWSKLKKQPQMGCRIAVGVALKAPPRIASYNPIDSDSGAASGGGGDGPGMEGGLAGMGRGMGSGGAGSGGGGAAAPNAKSLTAITGDMGKLLVKHVQQLFESGALGTAFANLDTAIPDATGNAGGFNAGFRGDPGGMSDEGGLAGMAGMGGGMSGPGMSGPGMSGPGMSGPGMGMGPGGMQGGRPGVQTITGKLAIPNRNRLTPGLTYLGAEGTVESILDKSLSEGYDLVVIYEVTVEQNRRGGIMNDCRARLHLPGEKKPIATTESFNNVDVMRKMQKGESGIVEKGMQRIFNKLDEEISLSDLPAALTAPLIEKRAASLVANKSRGTLDTLTELKLWNHKKLLSDEGLEKSFAALVGADLATQLLSGTEEERAEILKKYTP